MIAKAHIIAEIARTAKANGGLPLGRQRFYAETGIKETDWLGKYWARWGDAIREAGLTPRTLQVSYGQEHLLEQLASFARELGRFPGRTDIQQEKQVRVMVLRRAAEERLTLNGNSVERRAGDGPGVAR